MLFHFNFLKCREQPSIIIKKEWKNWKFLSFYLQYLINGESEEGRMVEYKNVTIYDTFGSAYDAPLRQPFTFRYAIAGLFRQLPLAADVYGWAIHMDGVLWHFIIGIQERHRKEDRICENLKLCDWF